MRRVLFILAILLCSLCGPWWSISLVALISGAVALRFFAELFLTFAISFTAWSGLAYLQDIRLRTFLLNQAEQLHPPFPSALIYLAPGLIGGAIAISASLFGISLGHFFRKRAR